ncbi:hypothetical protein BST61_g8325 [Cercospora zeina]
MPQTPPRIRPPSATHSAHPICTNGISSAEPCQRCRAATPNRTKQSIHHSTTMLHNQTQDPNFHNAMNAATRETPPLTHRQLLFFSAVVSSFLRVTVSAPYGGLNGKATYAFLGEGRIRGC